MTKRKEIYNLTPDALVPWGLEGFEDFGCGLGELGLSSEVVAVEVDGDVLEGLEGADDALDADPGGLLEVPGDGQGGHDHGQVRLDGIAGVVEDGAGSQVVLTHPERLLDVPQLVIRGDHLTGAHQACRNVGDIPLEAHQRPGPGQGRLIEDLIALMDGDKTRALGTLLAGDGWPGPGSPERSGSECPGPRASWSRPTPPSTTPDTRPGPRRAHDAC